MASVRLRALEPSDAQTLYEWENDPATWDAGTRRWPVSLADIKALIEHSDLDIWHTRQTRFMIDRLDDGDTVGCVDIFDFDPLNMHCSLGILIKSDARRKGFACEAIGQVCKFARETLLVNAVLASAAADNAASIALFKSAGFDQCGRLAGWIRRRTDFVDEVLLLKTFQ